jgi:rod shape determining protein RodA
MNRLGRQLALASNWPVLAAVGILSGIGLVNIWVESPDLGHRQLIYLCVAAVVLLAIQAVPYSILGRYAWPFYLLSLMLVIYTVIGSRFTVPGVQQKNGAYAWIGIKDFSLEPSELMKISFVVLLARYLRFRSNYRSFPGLLPPFLLALAPVVLILKQPELGVAALFLPTLLAMLLVAGARKRHILAVLGLGLACTPIFWLSGTDLPVFRHLPEIVHPYQRERVETMFQSDPKTLRQGGYQQERALAAMGSGGLSGKGLGVLAVGRHVPESYNDMIFALIGEQFGFIGSLVVIAAYAIFLAAGIEIAATTKEPFAKLIAVGLVVLIGSQAMLNMMVVMRLFPVTGVTLPFVSYGGSSLLASFVAAGLLLNVGNHRPLVIARQAFEFV